MKWLAGITLVIGLMLGATTVGATPNQLVYTPGNQRAYIYTQSPDARVVCANAVTSGTTASVLAYAASGAYLGGVIDATANGAAVCTNIGPVVEWTYGKVEKQSKPNCYRRYKAVRQSTINSRDFFAEWTLTGVGYTC
jgi:hypothetical protein